MYPQNNLRPGQSGQAVAQLQQFLQSQGMLSAADIATGPGIYGPRTTAAVKKWQQQNGVDNSSGPGYWGPRSIQAASGRGNVPETQASVDAQYRDAISKNPAVNSLTKDGSSLDEIISALQSGNLSGITDAQGMPFSVRDQQKALASAEEDNALYYEALQEKETAETESSLAQKQSDFQNYLLNSGQQFQEDKTEMDQSAADSGVLFSGGRVQKERNLERAYSQDQDYKRGNFERNIGSTAQDFQYKYGNKETEGLSNYFKAGSNSYNAGVATGGVSSNRLSNIYKPKDFNFQGTMNTERSANSNTRAAGKLWNKGNKLLATGYNNKY